VFISYILTVVVGTAPDAAAYSEVFALQVHVFGPWSMHTDEVCRRCLVRAAAALLTSSGSMGSGGGGGAGSSGGSGSGSGSGSSSSGGSFAPSRG
jgi:uncharacterized membrane protein YgcG